VKTYALDFSAVQTIQYSGRKNTMLKITRRIIPAICDSFPLIPLSMKYVFSFPISSSSK
jgi:hypothetical protein